MTDFVHLHVHSHYSLLDGLGKVEEYVQKAKSHGMKALALTDKANTHGLVDLYKACQKEGIKALLGCEMYIALRSRFDKEAGIDNRRHHIVLLAKNQTGYENLLRLSSEAFLTGMYYKPRIDIELLQEYSEGLISILPRVNGEVARHILNQEAKEAETTLSKYKEIFGDDLYMEMVHRPQFEEHAFLHQNLKDLSETSGVPLVATNDVYYVEENDSDAHDTLLCLQFNTIKSDPNRFHLRDYNLSFVEESQMREWFSDLPAAVENTKLIADKCSVDFEFGVHRIPKFPLPKDQKNEYEYLKHLCHEGGEKRYQFDLSSPNTEEQKAIVERLYFELDVIHKMGFDGYFLIVWDLMLWARTQDIAVGPGRGSAAGSLVSYLLYVTNLDPLEYNLLFERFLNPERISMPDIDLDFADDRRDEILEYVAEKYGRDHVAQICTFGTMAARAAVKDVGRVMGLPFTEMNAFGKLIPSLPGTTLAEAEKKSPELKEKLEKDEIARSIYENAKKFEGNVRHISVHACAVVIAPDPIRKYTAIQHPPKDDDAIITQYSAKPLEALGLLKMDFLGLRNLTILKKTCEIVARTKQQHIDLETLPMDDATTYELLSKALTTGVFQLESAGMRRYLKDLKPTRFEDIIAMVSLFRPGPMQFIPDYIERKHGKKHVQYVHKNLEDILRSTYGIAIYQEQILQMAQVFAGFTLGEADLLRRAIGKKIAKELKAQRQKFIDGAQKQGYEEKLAVYIFDDVIEPFANYGFNRSHGACYAMLAYQTAYLKANYPTEFFAALLSCDKENTDRVILDIQEARQFGIHVLPPNINESFSNFTVTNENEIRFGLTAIKGIGQGVVDNISEVRQQEKFATFADFLARVPSKVLNKKSLEALAKSGAFSEFIDPGIMVGHMGTILKFTRAESVTPDKQQDSLFGGQKIEKAELSLPRAEPAKLSERLKWEKEVLGIYVSAHPLQGMGQFFAKKGVLISEIPDTMRFTTKEITVHGLCTDIRKLITKKNDVMAIITLEDLSGKIEAVLFPKTYMSFIPFLKEDSFMTIKGKADKRNGEWQIIVSSLTSQELETIRQSAEQEGLLSADEEVVNIVEHEEEELPSDADGKNISENIMEEHQQQNSKSPYSIELPEKFSRDQMQSLHSLLSQHPGNTKVQLLFQGHKLTFPHSVAISKNLEGLVSKLID